MNSELSNFSLFASVLWKAGTMTAILPGIAIAFLFEKFGTGARRPEQSESGHVRGSNPRFVSDFLLAGSKSSGGGQLAQLIPASNRATSPSRKVRRMA
jgi:hypothetical protein